MQKQTVCQGSCEFLALRHEGPGTEGDNIASREGLHQTGDMSHCPQARQAGQAPGWCPGSTKRSSGKFQVMRQVQDQARRSIHRSGSGPVAVAGARHSPVVAGKGHGNKTGSRSSQEVSSWVTVQNNGALGQAQA